MLLAAGVNKLHCIATVPESKSELISAQEWAQSALSKVGGALAEGSTAASASGTVAGNPDAGKFPIKMKDEARGGAFEILRAKDLLPPDDQDEDEPDFSAYDF
eukprot:TRINITY_DN7953_c0_g1_i5.p1 TRINITY_DN7953_c0_g1~~TRINITY_DN7953_c0_g1_i5.p1  ORF type:complete len:103 (+),score=29.36 TRINITY_DN7953_c0_g1_i5:290-598(+)